jgi:hypothetical protein
MSSPLHASSFPVANIQEVVFYCESLIRAVCNACEIANDNKRDWVADGLTTELVSNKFYMNNYAPMDRLSSLF